MTTIKVEKFMGDENMRDKMEQSHFFIEANGFEKMVLWRSHEKETNWKDLGVGYWQVIGYIDEKNRKKSVCVSFHFSCLHGQWVCFFEATSRFVDHNMVHAFINKHFPDNDTRRKKKCLARIIFASELQDKLGYLKQIQ